MSKIKLNINGVIVEMENEEVSKAIEAGELTINNDSLIKKEEGQVIYSQDEYTTFKTNLANEEYKKGKEAGPEMLIKDAREKYGLEFEGKTMDNFAEALKTKVLAEAKVEPSKKIQTLEEDNKALRKSLEDTEKEFNTFKTDIEAKNDRASKDSKLMSFIPDQGIVVDKDIALMAVKNKLGLDVGFDDDNKMYLSKNGEPIKTEKTREYANPKEIIENSLKELKLIESNGNGSGFKDETGGAGGNADSYDKFVAEMEKKEINQGSAEFAQEMNKRIKEKTLKI